jgi:ribonuclease HII
LLTRFLRPEELEAGCDEAGRGCLAGPVCAAAVVLPSDYFNPLLNDSKLMSARNREILRVELEKEAISFGVSFVDNEKIDEINILKASILGMHQALDQITCTPHLILVDGNIFFPYRGIRHTCVIKGDARYLSIAAASILAKTYRDERMITLHDEFNMYGWNRNKGYPTKIHREAIKKHGISKYHRKSFHLLDTQKRLSFYYEVHS